MQNNVNNLNKNLKRDYFWNKIAFYSGNSNDCWKAINLLLNKRSKTKEIDSLDIDVHVKKEPADIAQDMNDYFYSVDKTLRDKISPQPNPLLYNENAVNKNTTQFEFKAIDTIFV